MRRLILKMSMSVDGFVAGPEGETDWMVRSRDEGGRAFVGETLRQAGLHMMGRVTYQTMAHYWPGSSDPLAAPMNDIPKVVFTRQPSFTPDEGISSRADAASWANAEIVAGDLATEVRRLKEQPGKDILAHGGAGFGRSLVASGLIDEYRLVVHPIVLGQGQALFAQLSNPLDLQLISTTVFRSGTTALVYRPAEPASSR